MLTKILSVLFLAILSVSSVFSQNLNPSGKKFKHTKTELMGNKSVNVYKIYNQNGNRKAGTANSVLTDLQRLNEPLMALAAFYSAMNGTSCGITHCKLTTSLGLGKQGSKQHKDLIYKYFSNDKVARTVLKQDCFQRSSTSSNFSDYNYITFTTYGDTIKVDYRVMYFSHGVETFKEGPDLYILKGKYFKVLKRNLWKHVI